jgi:hypothetical protein
VASLLQAVTWAGDMITVTLQHDDAKKYFTGHKTRLSYVQLCTTTTPPGACLLSTYFWALTWSDHLSRYSCQSGDFAERII